MAKSRLAAGALPFLLATTPVQAQAPIPLGPGEAAALDRAMAKKPPVDPACAGAPSDIIVCGRRIGGGGQRMEFEREPGEIVRHINEPGSGVAALAADRCMRLCNVGVSVDLVAAARAVPKIVRHILGKD